MIRTGATIVGKTRRNKRRHNERSPHLPLRTWIRNNRKRNAQLPPPTPALFSTPHGNESPSQKLPHSTRILRVTAKWQIPTRLHTPPKNARSKTIRRAQCGILRLHPKATLHFSRNPKQLEGLNVEYLGSTQNNPKQLEGLNVEYLGSTTTAKTSCCGQQQRTMLSLRFFS